MIVAGFGFRGAATVATCEAALAQAERGQPPRRSGADDDDRRRGHRPILAEGDLDGAAPDTVQSFDER